MTDDSLNYKAAFEARKIEARTQEDLKYKGNGRLSLTLREQLWALGITISVLNSNCVDLLQF